MLISTLVWSVAKSESASTSHPVAVVVTRLARLWKFPVAARDLVAEERSCFPVFVSVVFCYRNPLYHKHENRSAILSLLPYCQGLLATSGTILLRLIVLVRNK